MIGAGLLTFFVGLVIMLPARVVYRWVAPTHVSISGISGTVWNGAAKELSVDGFYLHSVEWHAKPWRLLTGKLSYGVTASPVSGFVDSDISIRAGGAVALSSLQAAVPLGVVSDVVNISGLQGNATLQFERIEFADGLPVAADGVLQVTDLGVPFLGTASLGGYSAEFFTQNSGIAASIEDNDAIVEFAGSLQVNSDRSFEFLGHVVTTPDTPASMTQLLQRSAPADDRGRHELRYGGTL